VCSRLGTHTVGLVRDGGVGQLDDALVGALVATVRAAAAGHRNPPGRSSPGTCE